MVTQAAQSCGAIISPLSLNYLTTISPLSHHDLTIIYVNMSMNMHMCNTMHKNSSVAGCGQAHLDFIGVRGSPERDISSLGAMGQGPGGWGKFRVVVARPGGGYVRGHAKYIREYVSADFQIGAGITADAILNTYNDAFRKVSNKISTTSKRHPKSPLTPIG